MKNPNAIVIFGQRYDGSNEVTIVPKIATSAEAGCVKPVTKTDTMTANVGIDSNGRLYTTGTTVDAVVTAFSDNAASSNAVYQYGLTLTSQMQTLVSNVKKEIEDDQKIKHSEIEKEISDTNSAIDELKTSSASQLDAIGKRIDQTNTNVASNATEISSIKAQQSNMSVSISNNSSDIKSNKSDINKIEPRVTQLESDFNDAKTRNIGHFFDSESELLQWLSIQDNVNKLWVGACLYINGNTQVYYVWNGSQAIKTTMLSEIPDGYLTTRNPTGIGYIAMNNNTTGSYGAVFGYDNQAKSLYSIVCGLGLTTANTAQAAFGMYNDVSKPDEIFTIGAGSDDQNRKTVHYISDSGDNHSCGDVTACDTSIGAKNSVDKSTEKFSYSILKIPDDVIGVIDYQAFVDTVQLDDSSKYVFTYSNGHWNSDCYDFSYVSQQQTQYYPIDVVGITFRYVTKTEENPAFDFTEGDTIEVYAPLQKTISLRTLYNTVNGLGLYIDVDGDVCQED